MGACMITVKIVPNRMSADRYRSEPPRRLVFDEASWRLNISPHVWSPPTDLYETEENIVVLVEIAGMGDNDFSIVIEKNFLIIAGNRPDVAERRAFYQMEIPFGEFGTRIEIPKAIDIEKVEAIYQDGFLKITLPKAKPTQIQITDKD